MLYFVANVVVALVCLLILVLRGAALLHRQDFEERGYLLQACLSFRDLGAWEVLCLFELALKGLKHI